MDALDLDILRTLGFLPFLHGARALDATRPSSVARVLRVSPELVKDRLQRMEEGGIVAGYEIHPNLRHLGLRRTTFHFHVPPERKPQALADAAPLEGVAAIVDFVGTELCVDLVHGTDGELARRVHAVRALLGAHSASRLYDQPDPPVARPLTRLDWRIVRALRGRARRPHAEVAEELGVNPRTVKRRLERMAAEGSIDVLPLVDPGRIPHCIPVGMAGFVAPGASAALAGLRAALGHRLLYAWTPPAAELGSVEMALWAMSTGEIEALRRAASEVPGVTRVDVLLPCGLRANPAWLDERIDARIVEAVSKAGAAGA